MTTSHPTNLAELLASMGAAGKRLNAIDAIEAGAGNLSASCNWNLDLTETSPDTTDIDLPLAVPNLAGYTPIHLLVPLLFAGLLVAFGRLARRDIAGHRRAMRITYVGACLVAGAFTLLPNRYLGGLLWHGLLGL